MEIGLNSIHPFLAKKNLSKWLSPSLLGLSVACHAYAVEKAPPPVEAPTVRFASTLQLSLEEPTPLLMKRAQALVVHEFDKGIQTLPNLQGAKLSVQRSGNEVIFSVLTDSDQQELNQVLMHVIRAIHGQVLAHGKYYRSRFAEPPQASFVVRVHDPKKRTLYINARNAPLKDLLQEIHRNTRKFKHGFSHYISPECTKRRVDLSFGSDDPNEHPKNLTLKEAMQGIAQYLQVQVKEESPGTYVFVGDCNNAPSEKVLVESSEHPFADTVLNPIAPIQVSFSSVPIQ